MISNAIHLLLSKLLFQNLLSLQICLDIRSEYPSLCDHRKSCPLTGFDSDGKYVKSQYGGGWDCFERFKPFYKGSLNTEFEALPAENCSAENSPC